MKGGVFKRWRGLSLMLLVILVIGWRLWLLRPSTDPRNNLGVRIERAIPRAVQSLERQQLPSGAFPLLLCQARELTGCVEEITPFVVTFVVHAFSFLPGEEGRKVRDAAVTFLIATQDRPGIWRHYPKWTREYAWSSPDSDDTACARASLSIIGRPMPRGLDELFNLRNDEGLFWLWFNQPPEGNEIDCAVNANVVFALALEHRQAPEAVEYLNRLMATRLFDHCSRYYLEPEALFYFVSRAYRDGGVSGLQPAVRLASEELHKRQRPDGSFGDVGTTVFGLLTWLNAGHWDQDVERALRYVLAHQRRDGGWDATATYGRALPFGLTYAFFASKALTTALALEALVKARNQRIW